MRLRPASGQGLSGSLALHAVLLLIVLVSWKAADHSITKRLPGTAHGEQQLLTFSLVGSPAPARTVQRAKTKPLDKTTPHLQTPSRITPSTSTADTPASGSGTSGESALGDGNITIALVKFHPRPAPDLSALPHGAAGDVVLDATIDAQGRIADLKVARGFGGTIDLSVVATVQQWTFSPATKDGVPVASEQEILFHYERS